MFDASKLLHHEEWQQACTERRRAFFAMLNYDRLYELSILARRWREAVARCDALLTEKCPTE